MTIYDKDYKDALESVIKIIDGEMSKDISDDFDYREGYIGACNYIKEKIIAMMEARK